MTDNYVDAAIESFEDIKTQLKAIKAKDHEKKKLMRVVRLYGAMSICVDVLRGLNGEQFVSEECDLPVDEMIRRIEKYTKDNNYDNSKEAQIHRYVALYDELFSKMHNMLFILN